MKTKLKRTIFHIAVYMTAAAIIFTLVFAGIYHFAYNELHFPNQKMKLNGAKNLLKEIPVIRSAEEPPEIDQFQGKEIQGEFVKKP